MIMRVRYCGLLAVLFMSLSAVAAQTVVLTTNPVRSLTLAELDEPLEVLRRERACHLDEACAKARREAERQVLLGKRGEFVYHASCEVSSNADPQVHGLLKVYGQLKDGSAEIAPWARLGFAVRSMRPAATPGAEGNADFSWYGQWEGPRDWPNMTIYGPEDGVIRTSWMDERELDMIAAASRVTMRTMAENREANFEYAVQDFAGAFKQCRTQLVRQITGRLDEDMAARTVKPPEGAR